VAEGLLRGYPRLSAHSREIYGMRRASNVVRMKMEQTLGPLARASGFAAAQQVVGLRPDAMRDSSLNRCRHLMIMLGHRGRLGSHSGSM